METWNKGHWRKNQQQFDIWSVLFSEQLSTVFRYLFSFVLSSLSLFLGSSWLWMGWQHSCSSSFHSFRTLWLVTMVVFSLSQLSAFVELWHASLVVYFTWSCLISTFFPSHFLSLSSPGPFTIMFLVTLERHLMIDKRYRNTFFSPFEN